MQKKINDDPLLKTLLDNIYDLERVLVKTIFHNIDYIDHFNVDYSVFVNVLYKDIVKGIMELKAEDTAINISTIYDYISSKGHTIDYNVFKQFLNKEDLINIHNFKNTLHTIYKNKLRIKLFEISSSLQSNSIDKSKDITTVLSNIELEIDELKTQMLTDGIQINDIFNDILSKIGSIKSGGEIGRILKTKVRIIDKKVSITPSTIMLIAGPAKHGKSKFATFLIRKILENNADTVCQWYSFEDDADELALNFISPYCMLSSPDILGKNGSLNKKDTTKLVSAIERSKKLPIDIIDKTMTIAEVGYKFSVFAKHNKGKIPICVIDNASLLEDSDLARDDTIMNSISRIRQQTKGVIIIIHHFNDEQMGKDRLINGFRPIIKDVKGRESYRRVPKIVLLINKPGMYPELRNSYEMYSDILKDMFIVDVAANRLKGKDNSDEETTYDESLMYFFSSLDYNLFLPLNELY